jgi:hypothetical protein
MGLPAMETRALPGKRVDEYRAGITPKTGSGTNDDTTKKPRVILELLGDRQRERKRPCAG